jgi:superfamily II DNA/RNA helicase
VDLAAAPGRTLVFTRTKRGAKRVTKHLNAAGVPAVELHGNLAQSARDRNLRSFVDGTAGTLVATDIAARGIHVDGVALVVHADPPVEHKAYLHRSGRTARAGADGTVVTLMNDDQVADVGLLARRAGISAATTRVRPGDPLLHRLAPGQRTYRVTAPEESTVGTSAPTANGHVRRGARRLSSVPSVSSARAGTRGTGGPTGKRQAASLGTTTGVVPQPSKVGGAAAFSSRSRVGRSAR